MKPSEALSLYKDEIRQLVLQNHAANPRVFGSVARQEDTLESDLDILIDTTAQTTLMNVAAIQLGLEKLLSIPVDVHTPNSLPLTFRHQVISEAIAI